MDLGTVLVGKEEIRTFTVKNSSRIPAIYRILDELLPPNLAITSYPLHGKIPPDGTLVITTYLTNLPFVTPVNTYT
jgi:hypothetical protein